MNLPKDIEAEIFFLTPEEGGRKSPAFSGYRPQFYYNNTDWVVSVTFMDDESAGLGQAVQSYVSFMSPEEHWGKVVVGMEFQLREGLRVVAKGRVIQLHELEESAKRARGSG